jgi:hypothetical protein
MRLDDVSRVTMRNSRRSAAGLFLLLLVLINGCGTAPPSGYQPHVGDILFQSLPHAPLVDAIEGVTQSPFSHCGIVTQRGDQLMVLEAIGPVTETPLSEWIRRGRGDRLAAYRLDPSLAASVPAIIAEARGYMGRPYDIHYDFDDERIYCSELIFKSIRTVTGQAVGQIHRIGELNWQPHEAFIKSIEGHVPKERELISPRALSEAAQLRKVYDNM